MLKPARITTPLGTLVQDLYFEVRARDCSHNYREKDTRILWLVVA